MKEKNIVTKKNTTIYIIIVIIAIFVVLDMIYENNNLIFANKEYKDKLLQLLEIYNAPSVKMIYEKHKHIEDDYYFYEIKFEISKEDYEKNNLQYKEKFFDELIDLRAKKEKDINTYICICRISNMTSESNEELYNKIRNLK